MKGKNIKKHEVKIVNLWKCHNSLKQAGAELGQAQLKLGLGFTLTIDS